MLQSPQEMCGGLERTGLGRRIVSGFRRSAFNVWVFVGGACEYVGKWVFRAGLDVFERELVQLAGTMRRLS
jgi:hypothetical protein